ncbi:MAG: ABC transporter ATP-binding protein [bacterium]|nr:ABC transporter ATP-binding protein [bacterium]
MASEFTARPPFKTDRSSALRFILSHIRRHPQFALSMIFGAFTNAALAAAVPYFVGRAYTTIQNGEPLEAIFPFAVAIVTSQGLRAGLQLMRNTSAEVFAQRIERDVRDELYASLLGKSMSFHDSVPVGEIMARVTNDVREINLMMNPGMNLLIGSGMFLVTPLIAALLEYPPLAITPALFLLLYGIAQYRFVRAMAPVAQDVRISFGDMNAEVAESLDGIQVVKGSATEPREREQFDTLANRVRDNFIRQGSIEARYVPQLLLGLVVAAGFTHGAILYNQGIISSGMVVAFMGQLVLFGFPVFSSLSAFSQASLGYASTKRILAVINQETKLDQNTGGFECDPHGTITFEGVSFRYAADSATVLHDASFRILPGQTVAIVGQTGSGKTTLTKLLNRTYDVTEGRVLIDDVDVREWNLASLRSSISIIEQDIFLFSRSIADNIRFGKPDATQEEVEAAARKAQAHDFILTFPEGYDTIVGQRGVTLSGGQRQRIAIARAFVTDPPILILDDSTSAIDSATEDHIQKAIWTAAKGRTTLLITHRLSQIRWADHIIVLRKGRIVAQGKHDDLMATSEAYRRIFARYEGGHAELPAQSLDDSAAHQPIPAQKG